MRTRLLIRGVVAVGCVAAAALCGVTYASVNLRDRAESRFLSDLDAAGALRDLRDSDSSLDPNTGRDTAIALLLLHGGDPAKAERTMARAAHAEPQNVVAWVPLARIQVARGRLAAARASWAHARRLDPHLPERLPAAA